MCTGIDAAGELRGEKRALAADGESRAEVIPWKKKFYKLSLLPPLHRNHIFLRALRAHECLGFGDKIYQAQSTVLNTVFLSSLLWKSISAHLITQLVVKPSKPCLVQTRRQMDLLPVPSSSNTFHKARLTPAQ